VRLEGKVALITGAESPIGTATALRFAREGALVVLSDIVSTHLDRLATEIAEEEGGRSLIALGDVTRPAHVERMVRDALDAFGRVDILVNHGPAADVDGAVQGAALCAHAVLPSMRARRWGRVINTAPAGNVDATALFALTKKLAVECARDGITVNCLVPGVTAEGQLTFDAVRKTIAPVIPMGRIADPREISAAHVFFASDDATYVTGQVLYVDGGVSASA
jgi:3-oxoacyl-[acyl-carrier protein] reductase